MQMSLHAGGINKSDFLTSHQANPMFQSESIYSERDKTVGVRSTRIRS